MTSESGCACSRELGREGPGGSVKAGSGTDVVVVAELMPVSMFQERCHRTACSFAGSARSAVRSWFWSCWWFVVKSARRMSEGGKIACKNGVAWSRSWAGGGRRRDGTRNDAARLGFWGPYPLCAPLDGTLGFE